MQLPEPALPTIAISPFVSKPQKIVALLSECICAARNTVQRNSGADMLRLGRPCLHFNCKPQ